MFTNVKVHNWTEQEYFGFDAVSNSLLKRMQDEPATTFESFKGNDATKMGSAFDQMLLEPERFRKEWTVVEGVKATSGENQSKMAKAILNGVYPVQAYNSCYAKPNEKKALELHESWWGWLELQSNRNSLSEQQHNVLKQMKRNTLGHTRAKEIVDSGDAQVCLTGVHETTGLLVKGMVDIAWSSIFGECDVKTTSKPWSEITGRWFFEGRNYDTQRALYGSLLRASGDYPAFETFRQGLIVVRTTGRLDCRVFDVSERLMEERYRGADFRETAFEKLERLLVEYEWRKSTENWDHRTGYYKNNGIEVL